MRNSCVNTTVPNAMSEKEFAEMQKKIDQGILLAQERLIQRAQHDNETLVVVRDGQVVEVKPEEL